MNINNMDDFMNRYTVKQLNRLVSKKRTINGSSIYTTNIYCASIDNKCYSIKNRRIKKYPINSISGSFDSLPLRHIVDISKSADILVIGCTHLEDGEYISNKYFNSPKQIQAFAGIRMVSA